MNGQLPQASVLCVLRYEDIRESGVEEEDEAVPEDGHEDAKKRAQKSRPVPNPVKQAATSSTEADNGMAVGLAEIGRYNIGCFRFPDRSDRPCPV